MSGEQAERSRKALDHDLHEAAERLSEYAAANVGLAAQKRKAETDAANLRADLDEAVSQLKQAEDRVAKASAEAARLSEELSGEQVGLWCLWLAFDIVWCGFFFQ